MSFSDIFDNPLTSLAESFVKNVFMDKVKPAVGSILKVDLAGGFASHTGVYIGNNEIVELYDNGGTGIVQIVSPNRFLRGGYGSGARTGAYIYCACNGEFVMGSNEIAERARNAVGHESMYDLMGKNAHAFTSYCITGRKATNKDISNNSTWTLMGVEKSLEEVYGLSVNAVTWRSTGDFA